MTRVRSVIGSAAVLVAICSAIALQVIRDRIYPREQSEVTRVLYVRSADAMRRLALGFDALAADVYWIRAIQHYGGDRLARQRQRRYELLYPLLDITTTLDPYFAIAYRFGAIFLSEAYPGGPGQPHQAVALLQKGITSQPTRWEYYQDIGFVYYWHLRDFQAAAAWFRKAAAQPRAPNWLEPLAASMLTAGGDRASARVLWNQILQADQQWLRRTARRSLLQLDALDRITELEALIARYPAAPGERYTWAALVQESVFPGVPLDPTGTPYELDPVTGKVQVSTRSELYPMPDYARRSLQ
jgi:tetratricopeptide (TPR) repeat protein